MIDQQSIPAFHSVDQKVGTSADLSVGVDPIVCAKAAIVAARQQRAVQDASQSTHSDESPASLRMLAKRRAQLTTALSGDNLQIVRPCGVQLSENSPFEESETEAEPISTLMTAQLVDPDNYDEERNRIIREARTAFAAEAVQAEAISEKEVTRSNRKATTVSGCVALVLIIVATVVGVTTSQSSRRSKKAPIPADTTTTMPSQYSPTPVPAIFLDDGRRAFVTTSQLQAAADAYQETLRRYESPEFSEVAREYGYPIGTWDVSRVTDFSRIFDPDRDQVLDRERLPRVDGGFDDDLSGWDVSKAISMHGMFAGASNFTGKGIDNWNVAKVTDFSYMFALASKFEGNVSAWNTSYAFWMHGMFLGATLFNADLSQYDVSKVQSMESMFSKAKSFLGGDLRRWNVSNVENMGRMFDLALAFSGRVSTWDTRKVTLMHYMFEATVLNDDLSLWSVGNVQRMGYMFAHNVKFEDANLTSWDTSRVVEMVGMFLRVPAYGVDISTWNVSKVQKFSNMFYESIGFDGDLSKWDTSNADDMSSMFTSAKSFNGNISAWNVRKLKNANEMFSGALAFN